MVLLKVYRSMDVGSFNFLKLKTCKVKFERGNIRDRYRGENYEKGKAKKKKVVII